MSLLLLNTMGYAEEIFLRKEIEISELKDYDKILPWLQQDKEGNIVRTQTRTIRDIAKDLAEPYKIEEEALIEVDLDKLDKLRIEASKLTIRESETTRIVDSRIEELTKEEVARQEALRAEEESRKFVVEEYAAAETVEEERILRRELKAELPYSLRSIKGWQTRRGKEAFREIFG